MDFAYTQSLWGRVPVTDTEVTGVGDNDQLSGEPIPVRDVIATEPQCSERGRLGEVLANLIGELGGNAEAVANTPLRFLKALHEMTRGRLEDPAVILSKRFAAGSDELVVLRGIEFVSLCEHHLLPFTGTADVGYLPPESGEVVGLSKLARLVDCFARRLQIQERMTHDIAHSLMTCLVAKGAAVVVRARHSCMGCRGVKKPGAEMVTSCVLGLFRTEPGLRAEFLELCKGR